MAADHRSPETRPSLILRLRDPDDMLAWQEFVELYQPLIRSLALRRGVPAADSDDVIQEVLTRVAGHVDRWDHQSAQSSFRAWLATITKNQAIQFFRELGRRPSTGLDSQIRQTAGEVHEQDFDLEHDRQLFRWAARRVQSRFADSTWKAFWMTAVENQKISDVADSLETSVTQIYVSRSRVMKAIRNAVEQSEFDSRADWRVS